jgi:hypothetical protein
MAIKVLRSREAMEELGGELEVHWKVYDEQWWQTKVDRVLLCLPLAS